MMRILINLLDDLKADISVFGPDKQRQDKGSIEQL